MSLLVELLDHCSDLFGVELPALVLVVSLVDDVDDLIDLVGFVSGQRGRDTIDSFVLFGQLLCLPCIEGQLILLLGLGDVVCGFVPERLTFLKRFEVFSGVLDDIGRLIPQYLSGEVL